MLAPGELSMQCIVNRRSAGVSASSVLEASYETFGSLTSEGRVRPGRKRLDAASTFVRTADDWGCRRMLQRMTLFGGGGARA